MSIILRHHPTPEDESWVFQLPEASLTSGRPGRGKHISFTAEVIRFQTILFPNNRILQEDDISLFVLVSFEQLRFPEKSVSVTRDYMMRLFQNGLFLNGVQYRFYGHSNSQLRSRSCFLRRAGRDAELDERIYALGDFRRINNAAKRAKRIGLLFSEAKIDFTLDPARTRDIGDIERSGENFSDGCGLISQQFAVLLSRHKKIIFRGKAYTPCVYQIRYRGYKGVLMLHPELGQDGIHVHFRKSQKKFVATRNDTFSVVNHSTPYSFARLNNDIVVLMSSLGVTTEKFVAKQKEYHDWISQASEDWEVAFDFLSGLGSFASAERVLLRGLDDSEVQKEVKQLQRREILGFKKGERTRTRTLLSKSRFLFGICDPYSVLQDGEVHVRVTVPRKGATTLTNVDVMIVRNPCLHPGDCLKLRAVHHPRLSHLVDCVVFATRGRRAAPSMSSGGDLDGDQFTVIWDPDLVPPKVAESYTYPPGREHINNNITREDLARHFASYNSISLGRITSLHQRWMRHSPNGAMCDECQELNALHSSVVDGASIKIPQRLATIPQNRDGPPGEPFVLDVLHEESRKFEEEFLKQNSDRVGSGGFNREIAEDMVLNLLSSERFAVSEYEIIQVAAKLAREHDINLARYVSYIDFSALSTSEKYAAISLLGLTAEQAPHIWNSLIRSDILRSRDLEDRKLGAPLHLQRLYSSTIQGRAAFFEYLREAVQYFNRRLILLKTDDRFSVGVFLRGDISWNDEPDINDNVMVCSFMPQSSISSSTYKRGTKGYKLHCSDNALQLYLHQRSDTFIFLTRPPEKSGLDIVMSIALQKISAHVLRQCGRVNRSPVVTLEIHVVSNRDRIAHQAFDLRFDHVETEERLPRFDYRPQPYAPRSLVGFDWSTISGEHQVVFLGSKNQADLVLTVATEETLLDYLQFGLEYRREDRCFWIFETFINTEVLPVDALLESLERHPPLVYSLLKKFLKNDQTLPEVLSASIVPIVSAVIRCANELGIAALVALEKLTPSIAVLDFPQYFGLLWLTVASVRSKDLVQEVLLVLHEGRSALRAGSAAQEYGHRQALAIAFDRAEDAFDTCPCDDNGRPRRQRTAPIRAKLQRPRRPRGEDPSADAVVEENTSQVVAHIRVDAVTPIRIHSHVRLQVASPPEHSTLLPAIVDAVVIRASRGELYLESFHPLPPEYAEVNWNMYHAGSVATSRAMLDAVQKLVMERFEVCQFHRIITADTSNVAQAPPNQPQGEQDAADAEEGLQNLNDSQKQAVLSARPNRLTLIWGPPGTGKTTVMVQILVRVLAQVLQDDNDGGARILMTASTHNAVDNVLERFIAVNERKNILPEEQILRAATDSTRVDKALQKFTIDARLGGSITDNPRLVQKAEKRVKEARIVFTTCTGAGLGVLRKMKFGTVLIDEASQITEPGALIPLVKGCRTAILVGDHVQLRPTVKPMGKALEFDKSLFERIWNGPDYPELSRTMLNVQYRFSEHVAQFPSHEFYEGNLLTGNPRETEIASSLAPSSFPWPRGDDGRVIPVVFVPCSSEEDYGRSSKKNSGQVALVNYILTLLRSPAPDTEEAQREQITTRLMDLSVGLLTPYSAQVKLLKEEISASKAEASTIDGFQGRESDIVVFSTVRSNLEGDIGFVEDPRRLNVAWTRPRLALIVVGDKRTLSTNALWSRALQACKEVAIAIPEPEDAQPSR